MAFIRKHWIRHRPFLYHFAPLENIERIIQLGAMHSAEAIVRKAHAYDPTQVPDADVFLSTPRGRNIILRTGPLPEDAFVLNDQRPMMNGRNFGNRLQCSREVYVRFLNRFVFFWPGKEEGPHTRNKHGQSFRKRYSDFAELRLASSDLWTENLIPTFCGFNSGAPTSRDGISRGPHLFVPPTDIELLTEGVVEVVFENQVTLPATARWRKDASSEWQRIAA